MPAKPIIPEETYADMPFPEAGLDLSLGFGSQRPGTTRLGENVRTYDPLEDRSRGGSRPGLVRYINGQVNGTHLIQHLNYVVDPQAQALPWYDPPFANPDDPDGPGIAGGPNYSASTPFYTDPDGNVIRNGGTGVRYSTQRISTGIQLVQYRCTGQFPIFNPPDGPFTLAFANNVVNGNMLLLAVATFGTDHPLEIDTVSDSRGNTYHQIGTTHQILQSTNHYINLAFYFTTNSGSGANTVTFTPVAGSLSTVNDIAMGVMEYSGALAYSFPTTPLDGNSFNTYNTPNANPLTLNASSVPVAFSNEAVIAAFYVQLDFPPTFAPSGGFNTIMDTYHDGLITTSQGALYLMQRIPTSGDVTPSVVASTPGVGVRAYIGIGAGFRKA